LPIESYFTNGSRRSNRGTIQRKQTPNTQH
jgi:hypothetical protein